MATNGTDQIDPITQQQIQIGQLMIQNGQLIIERAQMMQRIAELTPNMKPEMPAAETTIEVVEAEAGGKAEDATD